jgi:polyisoprenoid-binding protein YceI
MKKVVFMAAAIVMAATSFAQNWTLDKTHAKLGFSTTHLMVSEVEGQFKQFDVKLTSTSPDFSDAVIELTASVNSINTDNEQRDGHLKNSDFFDAAKYPNLTLKSKSLKKIADKKYKLTGDLTMHGITKPIEFDVTFNGTAIHPYTKKTVAGFKVTGTIKRSDFDLGAKYPSAVISDEVEVKANAEFIKD